MAGSASVPNQFGTASGNVPAANLDNNFGALVTYINVREVTVGVAAARPAFGVSGRWWCSTDVNGGTLYVDTGTAWVQVASGVTSAGGTVTVPQGGTGQVTLVSGSYLKGNGTSPITQQSTPLPVADLGSGSPSASNFLRGDGTWAVPAGASILDIETTPVTMASSIVETTVYSKSIPGGTLGTRNMLRLNLMGAGQVVSGAMTYRVTYGGTTIATYTGDTGISASSPHSITLMLAGSGATNSQIARMTLLVSEPSSTGPDVVASASGVTSGTAAIDSTGAQTLAVTVQQSVSSPSNNFTMSYAILEALVL